MWLTWSFHLHKRTPVFCERTLGVCKLCTGSVEKGGIAFSFLLQAFAITGVFSTVSWHLKHDRCQVKLNLCRLCLVNSVQLYDCAWQFSFVGVSSHISFSALTWLGDENDIQLVNTPPVPLTSRGSFLEEVEKSEAQVVEVVGRLSPHLVFIATTGRRRLGSISCALLLWSPHGIGHTIIFFPVVSCSICLSIYLSFFFLA